ncbi:MAG: isoaspartyl peptidase/L-asparaginase, partial [Pseudomonadota bacterium]
MTASWSIVIHGGADATPGRDYSHVERDMMEVIAAAADALQRGDRALDVAQQAVAALESSGYYIAGKGSSPNQDGIWELDAALMEGETRRAGAVSALEGFISPIAVARDVMETTPHVLLAGRGAAKLARAKGHAEVGDPEAYYDPAVKEALPPNAAGHGTVGAAVLDTHGQLAAATSTGGLLNKTPGRVGDSPIIGAGTWADGHVAVSCTGEGEYFLRAAAA